MKIVVLDGWLVNPGDLSWAPLQSLGELVVYDDSTPEQAMHRVGEAEALLFNRTYVGAQLLAAAKHLRYIGLFSTGTNMVDLGAATRAGVTVCNVPGYSTWAVAQHTIALLLEVTNQVAAFNIDVKAGNWQGALGLAHPTIELAGKTLGVIGFGEIGRAVGVIAKALGMRVLATGSHPRPEGERIGTYVDRQTLLGESDVVTLHCPLTPKTQGIINRETISLMKTGAILLNTARGALVVQQELAAALESGKLYAAAVDVVDGEPLRPDNPLLNQPRCLITPHVAWTPGDTRQRLITMAAENLQAYQAGTPMNVVKE